MKITRIKHVLVLKLVDSEALLMENISDINLKSQKKVWKIEKILDTDLINNNQLKYFIKQKDYSYKKNTQEPIKNLYYPEILTEVQRKHLQWQGQD